MENNDLSTIDLEFEISGEKIEEFNYGLTKNLNQKETKIAQEIHKIIFKKAWEIATIEELKAKIIKQIDFIDLVKIKLEFGEFKNNSYSSSLHSFFYSTANKLPEILSNELFCWIYYNEDEVLKTFRFILNISNGEIKFLIDC